MIANDLIFECGYVKRTLYSNPDLHKPHICGDSLPQQIPIGSLKLSRGANPLSLSSKIQKLKRQVTSYRGEARAASTLGPSPTGASYPQLALSALRIYKTNSKAPFFF